MYKLFLKRLLDLILATIGLPFLSIAFVFLAPIIFLEDKGPVFYTSLRIGKNGKLFKMYKFRSMRVNSPDIRLSDGSTYNGEDDPRVTKIGKFLRKTSLDEAPQLINVILGQMSIIGPRPDPPDWKDKYPDNIKVFLTVKPGVTGYSQAYFRNSVDGFEKMKNDAYYATHYSPWLDIKIFLKTISVVILHKNTYKDTINESEIMIKAIGE